jgi:signal transduction histidine kinase
VPYAVDGAVAVGLVAVTWIATGRGLHEAPPVGATLLAVAAAATVPARRLHPTGVFVAATVLAQAYLAATGSEAGILILAAPLIVLYTLARQDGWRWAAVLGGLALLTIFALHATLRPEWAGPQNVALLALGGFAVAAGAANRSHRAYVAVVEARARQAEQALEQEAERRVTEERLRIARELHDVLGHHLALITVHAGAAADVLDANPADARRSLEHIGRAGRTALAELRDVVVLLRGPGEPATPTEPAGGLARLDELLAACRRSGLCVDHSVAGTPRALSAAVDLAAFRVVQEALTNVAKHAHGSAAALRLRYERDQLMIVVEDDGPGSTTAQERGNGHGLDGMHERVSAVGGSFEAGPRPDGGFRVTTRLPIGSGAPAGGTRA